MEKFDQIKIVGLTGLAGCGKDTLANELKKDGWERIAFADALKSICIEHLGLTQDDVYTQEGKMRFNETWGMTNREILQVVGTDAMRDGFNKDVWVKIVEIKAKKMLEQGKKVVITDCRFDNEAELCEKLGGICVKIERPAQSNLTSKEQSHRSEAGINDSLITFKVNNNSSIEALPRRFNEALLRFEEKHSQVAAFLERYLLLHNDLIQSAENFLFHLKKCFETEIVKISEFKHGVVAEWTNNVNHAEAVMEVLLDQSKICYKMCKADSPMPLERGEFDFNNCVEWKKFESLLLSYMVRMEKVAWKGN